MRQEDMARGQAERLMGLLSDILDETGTPWQAIDALAVCTGPGNFTGIRISVAAARGLALGLGCPAVGVSALEARAFGQDNVLACVPAPRDHLYVQSFVQGAPKSEARLVDPAIETGTEMPPKVVGTPRPLWGLSAVEPVWPQIEAIARIAADRYADPVLKPPAPLYIKPADAAPARDAPPVILDA